MDRRLYAEAARARKAVKLVVAARRHGLTGLDLVSHPLVQGDLVQETGVHCPSGVTWALTATLLDELPAFAVEPEPVDGGPYVPSADDLAAMRDWCADTFGECSEDAADADVLSAVALHYDGGLDAWYRDGLSVYP